MEQIAHKLSATCYAVKSVMPFMSQETLRMVCSACFDSIMNYGFVLLGNSSHSVQIFKIQKNIIRIIVGCRIRDACGDLFKNQKILPLQSQYILFVVNNKNKFKLNSYICHINTRQKCNFLQASSTLSLYQKGVYSVGIKVLNHLPQSIKNLSDNPKQLKSALDNYSHVHSCV
jgi:hypothetical protein